MSHGELSYLPMEMESTDADSDTAAKYTHFKVKAPIVAGFSLMCFVWALESRILSRFVLQHLKNANQIIKIFHKSRFHESPMYVPCYDIKDKEETSVIYMDPALTAPERLAVALNCLNPTPVTRDVPIKSFHRWTICDYSKAYKLGDVTPTMVARRLLKAIEDSLQPAPGMGFFINYSAEDIIKQAELSTARYKKGQPLSILDGVPIAVKDEIDCLPYPTTAGTRWLHNVRKVKDDAVIIQSLRECGAMLVGKTNMNELGMGVTTINSNYGAARNPYDSNRYTGGSSGGSAAVVAAGLCPASLGVDGGGSVRIPSALCGIVGFKGTFGRISSSGVVPLNWTLGTIGVHSATVEDALLIYTAINGNLPNGQIISVPPPATLPLLKELPQPQGDCQISGITFAKYTQWFEDCDEVIYTTCYRALDAIQRCYGCKIVEVALPEINEMRLGHFITLGTECSTSLGMDYRKWGQQVSAMDTRATFAMYSSFSNHEFLTALRIRHRQMHFHMQIFKKADIIVTPTTGCTAQPISHRALDVGELNYIDGAKLMHYQLAANFLGLPAITIPVGYDAEGMPIGLQLLGRPWAEATLLSVASSFEKLFSSRKPIVFYDLLS
ncbi:hypothetical protein KP509_36G053400 [Ceratopteris richardii]|uniref:Amidase domain-containing protein n=1 Tax=Ceratopteris richardii TaxID=49495 RepID=A0A8T2QD74_CERRI|nr:hypothetical protein KP509_36G053400 [Ceratopteris richardii]